MTNGPAIVIERTFDNWPGGPQTLTELPAEQESGRDAFLFSCRLTPAGNEVWFRITSEAIERMPENTPRARGKRLVDALIVWLEENPGYQLEVGNHFQVFVTEAGDRDVTVKPEPDDE